MVIGPLLMPALFYLVAFSARCSLLPYTRTHSDYMTSVFGLASLGIGILLGYQMRQSTGDGFGNARRRINWRVLSSRKRDQYFPVARKRSSFSPLGRQRYARILYSKLCGYHRAVLRQRYRDLRCDHPEG